MDHIGKCRLCLGSAADSTHLYRKGYALEVKEFFKVQLPESAELSEIICAACVTFLENIKEFKNHIEHTQARLQQLVEDAKESESQSELPEYSSDEEHITNYDGPSDDAPDHSFAPDSPWVEIAGLVDIEEASLMDVEESSALPYQPESLLKKTCVRLAEFVDPEAQLKGDESNSGGVSKSMNDGLRVLRPKGVTRAEKLEKERKRRTKLVAEKKLDGLMRKLNILKCPICGEPQNTFGEIGKHFVNAHQVPAIRRYVFCCDEKQFRDRVYDHMRYHQKKDAFQCSVCGELCKSGVDHDRHIRRKHGIQEVRPVPCAICPSTFWTEKELHTHLYHTHRPTTGLECEECGKLLKFKTLLHHMKTVHKRGTDTFTCHICGKQFVDKGRFNSHVDFHEKTRDWKQCDECNKFFADAPSHKKRVHRTEVVYVECVECKKMCKDTNLRAHMKMNHENMRFPCTLCEKQFKFHGSLKRHMDIHGGVRHQCHFCVETFGAITNRIKHMQRMHAEEYVGYKEEQQMKNRGQNPYGKRDE